MPRDINVNNSTQIALSGNKHLDEWLSVLKISLASDDLDGLYEVYHCNPHVIAGSTFILKPYINVFGNLLPENYGGAKIFEDVVNCILGITNGTTMEAKLNPSKDNPFFSRIELPYQRLTEEALADIVIKYRKEFDLVDIDSILYECVPEGKEFNAT